VEHLPSHRHLMEPVRSWSASVRHGLLDAIVVPTSRSFSRTRPGIEAALDLAHQFSARVVIVCSGDADPCRFPVWLLDKWPVPVALLAMGGCHVPKGLLTFQTSAHPFARSEWTNPRDVARKRNLAVAVAVSAGWSRLLFLDDDIIIPEQTQGAPREVFGAASVAGAAAALADGCHHVIGWTMTDFPDNSAVCHARRLVGLPQSCFIGGGALAVQVDRKTPFFPCIYNEDWLFLLPYLHRRLQGDLPVGSAGEIQQAAYDPFVPGRPVSEEFGDVLAEGVLNSLEPGCDRSAVWLPWYWARVIGRRQDMIETIASRIGPARAAGALPPDRADALGEAMNDLRALYDRAGTGFRDLPSSFVDFLVRWYADNDVWRSRLTRLTPRTAETILSAATVYGASDPASFLS
jgi:hypothetical protein